jgi:SAM-dependent methyltransferase
LELKSQYKSKTLLDFGSGDGTMLKYLSAYFDISGLEPEINAREKSIQDGFIIYDSIEKIVNNETKFDLITMFHVIEHIYNPGEILSNLKKILNTGGILVLETPNSNDALLRLYKNKAFENWTYWSHHPMLYSHDSLSRIISRTGYEVIENNGGQRYSLANHLYWLSQNKPGGHEIWKEMFSKKTSENYNDDLVRQGYNDTLWLIARSI